MQPRYLPGLILFFLLFTFCKKEEQDVFTHEYSATIKVSVYHQIQKPSGDFENISVKDALVELYKSSEDRESHSDLVISASTDSSGEVQFYSLKEKYYYLRISHPTYGERLDETSTPDGSVSFVEVVY